MVDGDAVDATAGRGVRWARRVAAVALLVGLVAIPVVAGRSADSAAAEGRVAAAERGVVARTLDVSLSRERAAETRTDRAEGAAAVALAEREEQRRRLAERGLDEATIDGFLERALANTELVEHRRHRVTAEVDRQAALRPEAERCLAAARQAINAAFHLQVNPNTRVPTPSELCRALVDEG